MFLLTKAIHYLVNSAPCDVIANKSVNSLNESTLLSTEINYTSKVSICLRGIFELVIKYFAKNVILFLKVQSENEASTFVFLQSSICVIYIM